MILVILLQNYDLENEPHLCDLNLNKNKEIKENFFSDDMIIYATPISHINEEYGEMLRAKAKAL